MMTRRHWLGFVTLLITGIVVAVLGSGNITTRAAGPIEYRLKWLPNAGFAGDLYAQAEGYYSKNGLQVNVTPGGPDRDALTALLSPGSSTLFAVASADQVLQAIYRGSTNLRVVAQFYAGNPVQWIYRSSIGTIDAPAKLKGRRIGVAIGDNDETIMKAYLQANGIAQSDVKLTGIQFDYGPFLTGSVDLFSVYLNTQGVDLRRQMQKERVAVLFFDPARVGKPINFAANSLVTTSRVIDEQPDMVRRFVAATVAGWEDAMSPSNRERAAHDVSAAVGAALVDIDSVREQIDATRPLVKPTTDHQIGAIDVAAWKQTEDVMYAQRLLKAPNGQVPPKMGVERYLDLRFVRRN
ncbi:MAG TPA: ABC transporter substrate-binding protein [Xanthobacteraceae bacterium]|nr:ABC transporter substrate-binding protein [Xanthobacteraceae bacterium]